MLSTAAYSLRPRAYPAAAGLGEQTTFKEMLRPEAAEVGLRQTCMYEAGMSAFAIDLTKDWLQELAQAQLRTTWEQIDACDGLFTAEAYSASAETAENAGMSSKGSSRVQWRTLAS